MDYKKYKGQTLDKLVNKVQDEKRVELPGWHWHHKGNYKHILPLPNGATKKDKRNAIKEYLDIDVDSCITLDELHVYAHHLNSSQLLCYSFFRPLINGDQPKAKMVDIFAGLGITFSDKSKCKFEHKDNMRWLNGNKEENEDTSFDFYIKDGDNGIFFEIKFTEDGFASAKEDERHKAKIEKLYNSQIAKCPVLPKEMNLKMILKYYQLIRNVIRYKGENAKIVFITDGCNPSTNRDIEEFKKILTNYEGKIFFLTWQGIKQVCEKNNYNSMPFQFACF